MGNINNLKKMAESQFRQKEVQPIMAGAINHTPLPAEEFKATSNTIKQQKPVVIGNLDILNKEKKETKSITYRLDSKDYDKIEAICKIKNISVTDFHTALVKDFLGKVV